MKLINKFLQIYNKSDLAHRMANGALWSFSGTALAKLIVLIAGIVCARILGQNDFGEFSMVRSTVMVFSVVGLSGLGITATKYISEFKAETPERIPSIYILTNVFSIGLGIFISVLIVVLAPIIATETLNSPYLTHDLQWGGILLFFTVLNGVQGGILGGFEDFKSSALNTLYGSIAESILMCIGAYYYGVSGAIIGYGIGYIVIYFCNKASIKKILNLYQIEIKLNKFVKSDLKIIYNFSLPAALSTILAAPVFWLIKSMLVRHNGYDQLSIYEAADQWRIIILFIPTAISNVVLPILSGLVGKEEHKFWKVLKLNILLNSSIALIITVLVCLLGNWILNLYGPGFDNIRTLIILCSSTVFSAASTVIGLSISSRNKMWTGFAFNCGWALITILLSYIFINNELGSEGIALAVLCAYFIHSIIQLAYLRVISFK